MIELSASAAITLYLSITFLAMLWIWVVHLVKMRKRKTTPSLKKLVTCEYCACVYLKDGDRVISYCPQCESYNKS